MKINKGGNAGKRLFSSDKPSVIRLRYTLPVLFVVLLIFLKLPLLSIYFETVRLIITLAPMVAIVVVAAYAFYHSNQGKEPNRLGYYLLILKILLAILAFYILYAPGEFFDFFKSLLGFAGSVFTLEGLIFLSGPIAVISFLLFAGLFGYRSYQAKQGTYTGSITKLFKRLSFTLFFLFLALGSSIVMASPSAIKPMTDYLGDTIFTLSGGHIQVLKGTDVSQYKRLLSLKEMTSSLSTSLVDTSKNFSEAIEENKTTFKEDLSQSAQELASSISETTEDLKDKLEEDIDDKLPLGGGTLSGKLTIGKDLTVRGETEFEDTVNANDFLPNSNDAYDLGTADKKWRRLYVSVLDLGTNTVSDGEFSGDWNFSGGNLSNIGTLSADSYNGLTLSSGSGNLDLGSYSLVLSGNANLNQHLATTSSPTFLTLNTGQGDYELYAMDQNVLTSSSPTFGGLTLSGDLDLGSNTLTTGNTDLVSNLNADLLDGQHGSYYLPKANVSGTDNYLAKFNGTDGLESSVIYESGGNIGIGTAEPDYRLDINDGTSNGIVQMGGATITTGNMLRVYRNKAVAGTDSALVDFINDAATDDQPLLRLQQDAPADILRVFDGATQVVTIQDGGNVGIGTTSPGEALEVNGNMEVNKSGGYLSLSNGSGNSLGSLGFNNSTNNLEIKQKYSSSGIALFTNTSNQVVTIQQNGNVGIGTTAPAQKLQVAGRIRMDTWTADGDVAVYYNSGTGDIGVTASDERLKTNIETIPNALSIVQNIRGITFNWKDKSMSGDKSIGIIAQEALAVMPELTFPITGSDGKEYLGVHYDKISPILIEAVKEQQEQISNLQFTVSNEFSILNDSMTNLDSRLLGSETSVEDKIAVIGADLTELEDDFKALAGRVQGQEELFDSLTITTAGLTESVATLTELYGDHETRIAALENMVAEGFSGGDGASAELESLRELDSRLVLEDLGADGYRFDIDGNLKVKELEAEKGKFNDFETEIGKMQIGKMKQVILESPSGACFKLEINDQGQIESEEVDCQAETEE